MNQFGSSRALLGNSISAMLGAIEIYNKPQFAYRSECFVILLLNAWELFAKAILSKNRKRIFKPKERDKPYQTLGLFEALLLAKPHFPSSIPFKAVSENITTLADYRNNAVHFYNEPGMDVVVYGLAQTSIINFRDLLNHCFNQDIANEVNIALLPLSFRPMPDPVQFLRSDPAANAKPFIAEFLKIISERTEGLQTSRIDTGRFLTVFNVHLRSVKKIETADFVAGIQGQATEGVLLVDKRVDPNASHPLRRKDVLSHIPKDHRGTVFNERTFDALVWKYEVKRNASLCWKNESTNTYQYSQQLVTVLKAYTKEEIDTARTEYSARSQ